jgi:SAM-dependent methyltransferase
MKRPTRDRIGSARRSTSRPSGVAYSLSASVYDQIYASKDYAAEARRVRELVREHGPANATTLLDVACGTGTHLGYLAKWFDVTGVDPTPGMLQVARRKLPGVRLVRGTMQEFDLHREFDVITCLFSSIGYVRSVRDLRRTLRNFAAHLRPGGVAIVEPWLTPGVYRAGEVHLDAYGPKSLPIVRMNLSERRGDRSIMDMHHLVATPRGVRHWVERHDLGMFPVATFLTAFDAAGFRVRFLKHGLMKERGLYVAIRRFPDRSPISGRDRNVLAHA